VQLVDGVGLRGDDPVHEIAMETTLNTFSSSTTGCQGSRMVFGARDPDHCVGK